MLSPSLLDHLAGPSPASLSLIKCHFLCGAYILYHLIVITALGSTCHHFPFIDGEIEDRRSHQLVKENTHLLRCEREAQAGTSCTALRREEQEKRKAGGLAAPPEHATKSAAWNRSRAESGGSQVLQIPQESPAEPATDAQSSSPLLHPPGAVSLRPVCSTGKPIFPAWGPGLAGPPSVCLHWAFLAVELGEAVPLGKTWVGMKSSSVPL